MRKKLITGLALLALFFFAVSTFVESSAWARAGGGGSAGSRGGRSFSTPSSPSSPSTSSPGLSTPGRNPSLGTPGQPSGGFFSRSPFMQGMAGGLAGGLLGSLLFGGAGHASSGGMTGGGMGLLDFALIGLLLFFAYRFFKRRRAQQAVASGNYGQARYQDEGSYSGPSTLYRDPQQDSYPAVSEVEQGFRQMRQADPGFSEEALKETFQDLFFKVQAAWMNRSLEGVEVIVTDEMAAFFRAEFAAMKSKGRINRLENIAVRRVEPSEMWQETGKEYVSVLFTANLLDYTLDEKTGQVVEGDKLNPVKFQEFWTFCRDLASSQWKLSAINQTEQAPARMN